MNVQMDWRKDRQVLKGINGEMDGWMDVWRLMERYVDRYWFISSLFACEHPFPPSLAEDSWFTYTSGISSTDRKFLIETKILSN